MNDQHSAWFSWFVSQGWNVLVKLYFDMISIKLNLDSIFYVGQVTRVNISPLTLYNVWLYFRYVPTTTNTSPTISQNMEQFFVSSFSWTRCQILEWDISGDSSSEISYNLQCNVSFTSSNLTLKTKKSIRWNFQSVSAEWWDTSSIINSGKKILNRIAKILSCFGQEKFFLSDVGRQICSVRKLC